ncbi:MULTISPECIES: helix-turn-helix domain-containing protein [Nitrosomonas]|uniref:Uncharacterized protein n=1 Tax=Nitrosomonas communis TaxID=44574 RepID=A0A0F7KFB1_9PROT|nr:MULTISPECIES: helix-turn-helix domain-containing protein [Nitrosomonas]AKH39150.1 hypothetical protein AAW31_17110 [Nitrosomonas communis]TYP72340.1 hypothetical protein BCL69_11043 [Nitrosomonas communis]UVS61327.1 helix-turn-helix domain-containing protein [Nitrosomonas sp. PLL12]
MIEEKDIVEDIFSQIREIMGNQFHGEIFLKLTQIEARVRQKWGGTEPYVPKSREKKRAKAANDLKNGMSPKDVMKTTGISRSEVYKLLNRNNWSSHGRNNT